MYEGESRLMYKFRKEPGVPIGIAAFLVIAGIGAYRYKEAKKTMKTSMFLMQLRLAGQGALVGCMAVGSFYAFFSRKFLTKETSDNSSDNQ